MGEVYIDANSRDNLRDMKADYDLRMAGAQGRIRTPAQITNKHGGMASVFIGFVQLGAWDTTNLGYAWTLLQRNSTDTGWDALASLGSSSLGNAFEVNDSQNVAPNIIVALFRDKNAKGLPRNIFADPHAWFPLKIIGASGVSGAANQWQYSYTEQKPGSAPQWVDKPYGRTNSTAGYAYNSMETNNSASGIQGNGIDLSALPTGSVLLPIRGNPVVWGVQLLDCNGVSFVSFEAVNQTQCGGS